MRKHGRKRAIPREIGRIKGQSSTVIVTELGSRLSFRFAENDTLIQGSMYRDHPLDFRSEYLGGHLAASLCHAAPRRALCLGLGIGALPRLLLSTHPSIHIDCVESNDAVIKAASLATRLLLRLTTATRAGMPPASTIATATSSTLPKRHSLYYSEAAPRTT